MTQVHHRNQKCVDKSGVHQFNPPLLHIIMPHICPPPTDPTHQSTRITARDMASSTPVCTNCTDLRVQLAGLRGERDEYKKAYVEEVEGHELIRAGYEMRNTGLGEEIEWLRQRIAELEEEKARREEENKREEERREKEYKREEERKEEEKKVREERKVEEARKAEQARQETAVNWEILRQAAVRDLARKDAEVSRLKGHKEDLIFDVEKKDGEIARLKAHREDWVSGLKNLIRELEGESEDALRTYALSAMTCSSSTETANSRTDRRIIRENNASSSYLTMCWRCGWRLRRRLIRVDGTVGKKKKAEDSNDEDWD